MTLVGGVFHISMGIFDNYSSFTDDDDDDDDDDDAGNIHRGNADIDNRYVALADAILRTKKSSSTQFGALFIIDVNLGLFASGRVLVV